MSGQCPLSNNLNLQCDNFLKNVHTQNLTKIHFGGMFVSVTLSEQIPTWSCSLFSFSSFSCPIFLVPVFEQKTKNKQASKQTKSHRASNGKMTEILRSSVNLLRFLHSVVCCIHQSSWRTVVAAAVSLGIPTPAFSTALAFYDGYR